MRKLRRIVLVGAAMAPVPAVPTNAASPSASCPGQELSSLVPVLGSDLGALLAFEARNPELEVRKSFEEEVREFARRTPRTAPRSSHNVRGL